MCSFLSIHRVIQNKYFILSGYCCFCCCFVGVVFRVKRVSDARAAFVGINSVPITIVRWIKLCATRNILSRPFWATIHILSLNFRSLLFGDLCDSSAMFCLCKHLYVELKSCFVKTYLDGNLDYTQLIVC